MKINFFYSIFIISLLIILGGTKIYSQGFNRNILKENGIYFPETWEVRTSEKMLADINSSHFPGFWEGKFFQEGTGGGTSGIIHYQYEKIDENIINLLFLHEDDLGRTRYSSIGNMSIKRSIGPDKNGKPIFHNITFMIKNNRIDSYIRIYPANERSIMNIKIFGTDLYQNVIIPVSLEVLAAKPFSYIVNHTSDRVDWKKIFYLSKTDVYIEDILTDIRANIEYLKYEDDGAFNISGEPVYIKTGLKSNGGLNCSGFAKWIVDGIYFPLKKQFMDIDVLKRKHFEYRGDNWSKQYENERDPYFGLDWTRNLAVLLAEARTKTGAYSIEELDVNSIHNFRYIEDVGFKVSNLELLIYLLSQKYPGYFFLGSINRITGDEPSLRQHMHLIVIFPVFLYNGSFKVIVRESSQDEEVKEAKETGLTSVLDRYSDNFIHLVRIFSHGDFLIKQITNEAEQ